VVEIGYISSILPNSATSRDVGRSENVGGRGGGSKNLRGHNLPSMDVVRVY
jgi:hypothetical protein